MERRRTAQQLVNYLNSVHSLMYVCHYLTTYHCFVFETEMCNHNPLDVSIFTYIEIFNKFLQCTSISTLPSVLIYMYM